MDQKRIAKGFKLGALICFGLTGFLFLFAIFISILTSSRKFGPYHRPALINRFGEMDVVESPFSDERFLSWDGQLVRIDGEEVSIDERMTCARLFATDQLVFGSTLMRTSALGKNGVVTEYSFPLSFILDEYGYGVSSIGRLVRYSLATLEKDPSFELSFSPRTFFDVEGHRCFATDMGGCVLYDTGEERPYFCRWLDNSWKSGLFWDGGMVECNPSDLVHILSPVSNGKFYFASTTQTFDEKCVVWVSARQYSTCVCDFGKSEIFCVDTATGNVEKVGETEEGAIPIRAEKDLIGYFYKDAFYENGVKVKNSVSITTGEEYYEKGWNRLHDDSFESKNCLGYSKGNYYSIQVVREKENNPQTS